MVKALLAVLLSAGILVGAFLPWVTVPPVLEVTLWEMLRDRREDIWSAMRAGDAPWGVWCLILSLPVAAVSALANLGGLRRVLCLLAGALPIAALVWIVVDARRTVIDALGGLPDGSERLLDFAGQGLWLYLGASLGLVALGLLARRRR